MLVAVALCAAPARAQSVVGQLYSGDASVRGSVQLSAGGMQVLSGSQVAAGEATAKLKLERGGELRICARTRLSLNEAGNHSLVLGLNAGAMELDYELASGADMLLTPDFRLQLISPGSFRLAVSVTPSGDTCMRTLHGDDASVFITEMAGTQAYQLAPGKGVLFRGGKMAQAVEAPTVCGCPELSAHLVMAPEPPSPARSVAETPADNGTEHLEVHNAFILRGNKADDSIDSQVAHLSISRDSSRLMMALLPTVTPPSEAPPTVPKKPSFKQRVESFFGRIFHK
jgi:hypothetical protein